MRAPPPSRPRASRARPDSGGERFLYGRHAVEAALANPERRWRRLFVIPAHHAEAAALVAAARARQRGEEAAPTALERERLAALLPEGAVHQGWALAVEPLVEPTLEDVLSLSANPSEPAILVILDQVTDPHNVGAVLRSAAAFGALAVILAAPHGPAVTGLLGKTASGALDCLPLVRVVNLARTIERLKTAGFWSCGLDENADSELAQLDLGPRAALVLGAEGGGLRRLVRESCDHLARLPTGGPIRSLNVSNAAAVALYELVRARPRTIRPAPSSAD